MSANKPYILIADDELINQEIFQFQLSDDYEIDIVDNGKECLRSIKNRRPDVLLLDIHMPVMSGFDVLLELRESPAYKDLIIIFVTATPFADIADLPKDLSANNFLIKPYERDELLSMIKNHL